MRREGGGACRAVSTIVSMEPPAGAGRNTRAFDPPGGIQRPRQVPNQVVDSRETDGQAHKAVADAHGAPVLLGHGPVGRGHRMEIGSASGRERVGTYV